MKAGRKSMAQRRRVSNTPYIYDNTARDLQIRRQMEELGMTYAAEGQVITYANSSNDYMRQADTSQN